VLTILLWCLVVALVLLGLAGTILPVLPGTVLMFVGMVLGAWIDDFERVSTATLVILGALTALSILCDVIAGALGAKRLGASPKAVAGAAIGTVAGLFTGLWGLVVMPLAGAAIGEYLAQRDVMRAGEVGVATAIGLLIGAAVKIAFAFAMIGVFVVAVFV
jgi:uncharacterized protein YqgC (DUF456 family)